MSPRRTKQREVRCPYCENLAVLVNTKTIYPFAPKDYGMFWQCKPCDAYVGTHKNSKDHAPYGMLADKNLRNLRSEAHANFDPIWEWRVAQGANRAAARKAAYTWLAEQMQMPMADCHIGMFGPIACIQAIHICKPKARALQGKDKPKKRKAMFGTR